MTDTFVRSCLSTGPPGLSGRERECLRYLIDVRTSRLGALLGFCR